MPLDKTSPGPHTSLGDSQDLHSPGNIPTPDNGKNPWGYRFTRWYTDDVTGMLWPEDLVLRDWDDRLRFREDVDDQDRGHVTEYWDNRLVEEQYEDP